jgi:hypothetical protein
MMDCGVVRISRMYAMGYDVCGGYVVGVLVRVSKTAS